MRVTAVNSQEFATRLAVYCRAAISLMEGHDQCRHTYCTCFNAKCGQIVTDSPNLFEKLKSTHRQLDVIHAVTVMKGTESVLGGRPDIHILHVYVAA